MDKKSGDILFAGSLADIKRDTRLSHADAREEGGYIRPQPEWFDMARGIGKAHRNCFYDNLKFIRERNNPFDRLCVASLSRMGKVIHHCFIMNGDWIIDHSNLMRKKIAREQYFAANSVVDFTFIKVDRHINGDIIADMAQTLKMTGARQIPKQHGSMDAAMLSVINL